jgi:anti-anti-sigma factor
VEQARFDLVRENDVTVLTISGEVDIANANELRHAVQAYVSRPDAEMPVIDLTKLLFIDSSGLHALLEVAERMPHLVLRNPNRAARRAIDIVLPGAFHVDDVSAGLIGRHAGDVADLAAFVHGDVWPLTIGDPHATAIGALARFLSGAATVGETLRHLATTSATAIPGAAGVGIAAIDGEGTATTVAFTDPTVPEVDAAQYRSASGPCLDAWRERRAVRVDDLAVADAYPEFRVAAGAHGFASTLSLPLLAGSGAIGSLNLYARTPRAFGEADERVGVEVSTAAAVVLLHAGSPGGALDVSARLDGVLQAAAVIEQAKGVLLARDPALDAAAGSALLEQTARRAQMTVYELAREVVRHRGLPPGLVTALEP